MKGKTQYYQAALCVCRKAVLATPPPNHLPTVALPKTPWPRGPTLCVLACNKRDRHVAVHKSISTKHKSRAVICMLRASRRRFSSWGTMVCEGRSCPAGVCRLSKPPNRCVFVRRKKHLPHCQTRASVLDKQVLHEALSRVDPSCTLAATGVFLSP